MSGAFLRLELDLGDAFAYLTRIENGLGDAKPLFTEIGSALEGSTRERFETKRAPDGTPWLDISPGWRAHKKAKGLAEGILTMRGDLLSSIAFEAGTDFVEIVAGPQEYAAIHQFGGTEGMAAGPAAIPARPYLGLSADDEVEIREATDDWLRGLIGG
jgi:phage virion morphogenesis protein